MEMGKLKKMFSIALSCVFLLTLCNVESVFAADFTAPEGKLLTSLKQYSIAPTGICCDCGSHKKSRNPCQL